MNAEHDHLELIRRSVDGTASGEDHQALQRLMRREPAVRGLFARYANLDASLGSGSIALGERTAVMASKLPAPPRWLSWRPLAAAAAGMVIGCFGVTAVWALVSPHSLISQGLPVAASGFELTAAWKTGGVPVVTGEWAGDPCEVVGPHGKVRPHSGGRMLRFLHSDVAGDFPGSKALCADAWQVFELPGTGVRTVRIRALFNAETAPKQARFHLMAVAGSDDAASAPALWEKRYGSSAEVLAMCRTMKFVDMDPGTWEPAEATLEVPAEARVLVVGIAAYRLPVTPEDRWFPAQYADDVSVTVIETFRDVP